MSHKENHLQTHGKIAGFQSLATMSTSGLMAQGTESPKEHVAPLPMWNLVQHWQGTTSRMQVDGTVIHSYGSQVLTSNDCHTYGSKHQRIAPTLRRNTFILQGHRLGATPSLGLQMDHHRMKHRLMHEPRKSGMTDMDMTGRLPHGS